MKRLNKLIGITLMLSSTLGFGQPLSFKQEEVARMKEKLGVVIEDTSRVNTLWRLARYYSMTEPQQAVRYATESITLAKKLNYTYGELAGLQALSFTSTITGQWQKGMQTAYEGLQISQTSYPAFEFGFYNMIALVYEKQRDSKKRLEWLLKAYHHPRFKLSTAEEKWPVFHNLGEVYESLNSLDSAMFFAIKTDSICRKTHIPIGVSFANAIMGRVQVQQKNYSSALHHLKIAMSFTRKMGNPFLESEQSVDLAVIFHAINQPDSAIYYAEKALVNGRKLNNLVVIAGAAKVLAKIYEKNSPTKTISYLKILNAANDSLYTTDRVIQTQNIVYAQQQRIRDLREAKKDYENSIRQKTLIGILIFLGMVSLILIRNNKQKQRSNIVLKKQKEEIDYKSHELEQSLEELKSTQAQLIQKEKLASLGELTAGIAHEIQNPLNFVNNFSELSVDLVKDLKEEIEKSPLTPDGGIIIGDTVYFNELISDLTQNQEKINHHGKRASSIVKGMLEHSRMGTGERVLTDINVLCDEYLRLSYHGMRAKNKDFNSDYKTDFDENLPKINIVPQEIGRVLLNLMNNAFYTVHERAKQGESGYQAKVTVSTRAEKNHLEIRVQDNGMGVPDHVKAKIFQPFFTTKPTGEGTGLGLSLSYDIVTKGHGGTLEVESVEGEGATFVVKLPIV